LVVEVGLRRKDAFFVWGLAGLSLQIEPKRFDSGSNPEPAWKRKGASLPGSIPNLLKIIKVYSLPA